MQLPSIDDESSSTTEQRIAAWAAEHRLRPSKAPHCPRVVTGKRCQIGMPRWYGRETRCICEKYRHLLDHARTWLRPDGYRLLTAEPYDPEQEDLAKFTVELEHTLGVGLKIESYSPYYPGHTTLLMMWWLSDGS
jgi:hypothetical protein